MTQPRTDPDTEPETAADSESLPMEASVADVVDQRREAPFDEEDDPR